MGRCLEDFRVAESTPLGPRFSLLKLVAATHGHNVPECLPGQFAQVATGANGVLLRRPISICRVDSKGQLWLLVRRAGKGTEHLCEARPGDAFNLLLPLGGEFPTEGVKRPLLVGGGVGIAPMMCLADKFHACGIVPEVLIGARSEAELLLRDELAQVATLHTATDDGSYGFHGLVADHPALATGEYDAIYCCGPAPMMKAVAAVARRRGIPCWVSLENMMACGLGACLCCVENTVKGNVCVCTEGPVFNIDSLTWTL